MKNYYQQKKGGWRLEPVIYAKTVKQIGCYRFFQNLIQSYDAESSAAKDFNHDAASSAAKDTSHDAAPPQEQTETAHLERMAAEQYVRAIDQALQLYVPAEYRNAVFAHLVDGAEYTELEERYFLSASTMKRYVQVFVWGVAEELGENFRQCS